MTTRTDTPTKVAYTVTETAQAIGRSDQFVLQQIAAGLLRAKRQGRAYLIPAKSLNDWIEALPDA
jgi:excisionase family DNA binding protein